MAIVSVNGLTPTGRVKRLIRNYKKNKWSILSTAMGEEDTKSVYFDQEFVSALLKELQEPGINGLRVYFGSYEKDHPNEQRAGKMTIIFVTTVGKANLLQDPKEDEMGPLPHELVRQKTDDVSLKLLDEMNDGALCPPLGCNTDPGNELWPNP